MAVVRFVSFCNSVHSTVSYAVARFGILDFTATCLNLDDVVVFTSLYYGWGEFSFMVFYGGKDVR